MPQVLLWKAQAIISSYSLQIGNQIPYVSCAIPSRDPLAKPTIWHRNTYNFVQFRQAKASSLADYVYAKPGGWLYMKIYGGIFYNSTRGWLQHFGVPVQVVFLLACGCDVASKLL
jgi:hypothetical protein